MKKKYLFFLILFFISCSNLSKNIESTCGIKPNNINEIAEINNPNFVFEKDENFNPILLVNEDGTKILVNSYLECENYVNGGWKQINNKIDSNENNKNLFFYFIYIFVVFIFIYGVVQDLKIRKLSRTNIKNYFPLIFLIFVSFNITSKLHSRGLYFSILTTEMLVKYGYLLISFLTLYYLSKLINEVFSLDSYSLAITYYFCSFFIIDYIFIFLTKYLSFLNIFFLVSTSWIIVFLIKSNSKKNIVKLITSYLLLLFYNNFFINFFNDLSNYKIRNNDVTDQWLPLAKLLYENNLFYAIENNFVQGYGFLLTYVQVLIHKFNFSSEYYFYSTIDSNLLVVFFIFILIDSRLSKINKILLFFSFMGIVLDDGWLRFLIFDSLMLEGFVSFLSASFILNFSNQMSSNNSNSKKYMYIIFLSTLFFSKQFVETLILLFILVLFIFNKFRKYSLIGILIYILSLTYNTFLFKFDRNIEYIDQSLFSILKEMLLLQNANWNNLNYIVMKLLESPFIFFILLTTFVIFFFNNFYSKSIKFENTLFFIFIYTNILFVMLLYVFIWRDTQLDSSYRYINNFIFMYFVLFYYEMERIQTLVKRKKLL